MDILWSRGTASAADVQTALMPNRTLKDSTVRTVLTRLEEKGYIRHAVDGRTFIYSAVQPPGSIAVRAVKQIIDRLCHGSVESLLVGMVDGEVIHPEDLRRIANRVTHNRKEPRTKSRAKKESNR